ncbi:hypothetical protein [Streptomyces sp. NPDC056227]|uniref:hypothetical protein n=1 Tax=Streptomyces sp. NPDC056227 TaxID=3345753 RepID=UPI0035DC3ED5
MTGFMVVLVLVVAAAAILRWRRPAWYWLAFGATLALIHRRGLGSDLVTGFELVSGRRLGMGRL